MQTELLDAFNDSKPATGVKKADGVDFLGFRDAIFSWKDEGGSTDAMNARNFRLHVEGELSFKIGAINLIVGPTGSGKTSLLMALLGKPERALR